MYRKYVCVCATYYVIRLNALPRIKQVKISRVGCIQRILCAWKDFQHGQNRLWGEHQKRFPCGLSPADIIGIIGHTVGFGQSGDLGGNDKWKASTSSLSHPAAMCRGSAPLLSPQWKHHLDLPRVDFNWTNTNIPSPDFYIPPKLGPQNE